MNSGGFQLATIKRALNIWRKYIKLKTFAADFCQFNRLSKTMDGDRFSVSWGDRYPCLDDKIKTTEFDRHYLYHPAWAARILAEIKPIVHVDISSTLHFASIVSAFVPVQFFDFRPADIRLDNFLSDKADILKLPFPSNSVVSISCMHVVEHIGLGRYGDPLDPSGDLKAITELKRVLAKDGNLLFVVPVGKPRIMFNAHRIYSYEQIVEYFAELELVNFALISERPEDGGLKYGATSDDVANQQYGCGCFWFKK
jgi:SAM-dependent methyltransferase